MYNNARKHGSASFKCADYIVFSVSLFAYRVWRFLWQGVMDLKHSIKHLLAASELNIIQHRIVRALFCLVDHGILGNKTSQATNFDSWEYDHISLRSQTVQSWKHSLLDTHCYILYFYVCCNFLIYSFDIISDSSINASFEVLIIWTNLANYKTWNYCK